MSNSLTVHPNGVDRAHFDALVTAPRTINSPLIPLEAARGAIAVLNQALEPATNDEAVKVIALLIGSYPRHAVDDPDIYTRAMKATMLKYPKAVGFAAIDALTERCKFLPTRAELKEELERQVQPMRDALGSARWMAQEHARRKAEAENEAAIEEGKRRFREKHGGKSPLEVLGARFSAEEPVKRGEE